MPCQNGGTCHERCTDEPDYECVCPPDFVGKNCTEVNIYVNKYAVWGVGEVVCWYWKRIRRKYFLPNDNVWKMVSRFRGKIFGVGWNLKLHESRIFHLRKNRYTYEVIFFILIPILYPTTNYSLRCVFLVPQYSVYFGLIFLYSRYRTYCVYTDD